jgi:undecaprenyl diphosphate synthase
MSLAKQLIEEKSSYFVQKGVRFIHLGDRDMIREDIVESIKKLEEETKNGSLYTLCVAFNYGGRHEIINAIKKMYNDIKNEIIKEENISEETFNKYLYHPEIPDVDLIIRTSNEQRISNFMLWRAAYSEFYFTDVLWPDFQESDFIKAIIDYQSRERRFGKA